MVMIPMECPKCGRRGSVPSTRLNTPFNCKNCNAPFYLNTAGEAISGEPPVPREAREKRTATATKAKRESEFGFNFDLFSGLRDMPSGDRTKKLGMIAGFLAFIAALYYFITMPRTDPLLERGNYVAKAFADNDEVRIRAVAAKDTEEDAAIWLDKARSMLGMKGRARDFSVTTDVMSGGPREGGALLMATYNPLSPSAVQNPSADKKGSASDASGLQMLTVNMFFIPDDQGQWRLDGRQSLSSADAQMKAQKKMSEQLKKMR